MPPAVSVIIPVHNGSATVERALRSLAVQTFPDWEAVMVDDGSTDCTREILGAWAAKDARCRVIALPENRGLSAARNAGLREVQGEFIAYLDDDDEYYPDYLEQIAALRGNADVLVFGFDMLYEDGPRGDRPASWDPTKRGRDFFSFNPAVPLGMSHRRSLLERAGRFNEMVWLQEDWDLWKRMARAGAKFSFVSAKSGIYHIRPGTLTHSPRLSPPQREAVLANWLASRPIFTPSSNGVDSGQPASPRPRTVRKIAVLSPHCLLDAGSDTARSTLNGLQLLANAGFECQAFCGTHFAAAQGVPCGARTKPIETRSVSEDAAYGLANASGYDAAEELLVEEVLARRGLRYEVRNDAQVGPHRARMLFTCLGGKGDSPIFTTRSGCPVKIGTVPLTLFNTVSTRGRWRDEAEIAAFLTACAIFLTKNRPDAVWAYGLDPVAQEMQRLAMRLDIPIVLSVDDADYADDSVFQRADYAIVGSERERQFHWERIGLASIVLPPVADPAHAVQLEPLYSDFFASITHQPGPPLVPRQVVEESIGNGP